MELAPQSPRRLFEPLTIGRLTARNRIEAAPAHPCLATAEGHITRELIDYYAAKAKGGAGIVTVGECVVDRQHAVTHGGQLILDNDNLVPSLYLLAEAIKRHGALASIELNHGGRQTIPSLIEGRKPIAPSAIPSAFHEALAGHPIAVQEMDRGHIETVIENFAAAAHRVRWAGFDMILLHGGHGWLLAQFLSPFSNKRTDEYGGSLENRARFPLQVLRRIRDRVGSDLAIEYRMCGSELIPGGLTTEDAVQFARMIEGEVDCIQVSTGIIAEPSTIPYFHPPTYLPHGLSVSYAARIKKAVRIPVATVGAHVDPVEAEAILRERKADLVAMARGLIADPAFPAKIQKGETDELIPCIRCNECLGNVANFLPLRCAVNPVTGRETELRTTPPARNRRDVLVVGGGPAGLQAAMVAASRGHRVTLFEKSQRLGGNLAVAAVPDFKDDLKKYLVYLERAVRREGVDVRLGVEATPELVREVAPEVLVLATGAEPAVPDIPGADGANVLWAGDALASPSQVGGQALVIGGGLVGCETALFLARQGKKVTVTRRGDQFATDMNEISRGLLLELLAKEGVELRGGVTVEEIQEDGAMVLDKASGSGRIEADTVVWAIGLRPRVETLKSLEALAPIVHVVGDCLRPRKLIDATREAFFAALEI